MKTKLALTRELTHDEAATVLAALRLFQEIHKAEEIATVPNGYLKVNNESNFIVARPEGGISVRTPLSGMEHFEDAKILSVEEIDELCEAINLQPDLPATVRNLKSKVRAWEKAADGDSNDAEHEAAYEMAEAAKQLTKAIGNK